MRKTAGRTRFFPGVMFATMMLVASLVPTTAAVDDWATIRILATVLRGTNEVVKQVFTEMKDSVNQYGIQEIIAATGAMNGGRGMARTFDGGASYVLVKSGPFAVTSGAAAGKTFPYLLKITDTSPTPVTKLLFYFDDVNAAYEKEALLVVVPSWFDGTVYSGTGFEVYLYRDGETPSLKITVDQALIQGNPLYWCADIRALVQDTGSTIEVSAFGYYNSGDTYKGYYTLGFSAMKSAPNNSRAFQGALLSDTAPSNNGLAYVGASTGNRNYGLFNSDGGGSYVGDQISTDQTGYPSVAEMQAIYGNMGTNASYFNAGGNLSALSISLSSYPQ